MHFPGLLTAGRYVVSLWMDFDEILSANSTVEAPQYLIDYCLPVSDVASRQHLCSASRRLLVVPRHRLSTCASGCVVECRIRSWEVAGSNVSPGYFTPGSTQPSILRGR